MARSFFILIFAVGFSACSTAPTLHPASNANSVEYMRNAAVSTVRDVTVVAEPDAWTGDHIVTKRTTPISVMVENKGTLPIALRFSDFYLVNENGKKYPALPFYTLTGSEDAPLLETTFMNPMIAPKFTSTKFRVAGYAAKLYPQMSPTTDVFRVNPSYYSAPYSYWGVANDLPKDAIVANGIPEGTLMPGGRVQGFLYFEHVDYGETHVTLRTQIVDAADGKLLGITAIPFSIDYTGEGNQR